MVWAVRFQKGHTYAEGPVTPRREHTSVPEMSLGPWVAHRIPLLTPFTISHIPTLAPRKPNGLLQISLDAIDVSMLSLNFEVSCARLSVQDWPKDTQRIVHRVLRSHDGRCMPSSGIGTYEGLQLALWNLEIR